MNHWGVLGASWEPLGALLGPLGGFVGASWGLLGGLVGPFGVFWELPGGLQGRPGSLLARLTPSEVVLGASPRKRPRGHLANLKRGRTGYANQNIDNPLHLEIKQKKHNGSIGQTRSYPTAPPPGTPRSALLKLSWTPLGALLRLLWGLKGVPKVLA